jgi:hypothetical protein
MESEMAVFNRCDLDVRVFVNQPGADVVTEEHMVYRHCAASIRDSDLGTNAEILHSRVDQFFCSRWPIDMDRFRTLAIPRRRHQRTKSRRVIVMMVRDENNSDLSYINTRLRNTPDDTVAGINAIVRAVDG